MVAARGSRSSLCPRESPPPPRRGGGCPCSHRKGTGRSPRRSPPSPRPPPPDLADGRAGGRPVPLRAFVPGARRRGRGPLSRRSSACSPRAARPGDAPAPGRGSRAALFRARPRASQAQPTRPFPSPSRCLRARDPGRPPLRAGQRRLQPLRASGSSFFCVCVTGIRWRDRGRDAQLARKERAAGRCLDVPPARSFFSLLSLFLSFLRACLGRGRFQTMPSA